MKDSFKINQALKDVSNGMSLSAAAKKHGLPRSSLRVEAQRKCVVSPHQEHMQSIYNFKQEAIDLRKTGLSISKISKRLKIASPTISRWCDGIVISEKDYLSNFCQNPEKKKLAIQYRKDGMYLNEIAKNLGCAKSTISVWLKSARVEDSNLDISVANRKFEISFENEYLKYAEEIISLRISGNTFQNIANKINKSVDFVRDVFNLYDCSEEQKKEIKKLVDKNVLDRRHSGELKPVGGLRKGVERSKFGYYKGIYCSSTYELCWVIYNLDHGKEVKRFDGFLECQKNGFKYYPDFIENGNHIIEIKGYEREDVKRKTKLAQDFGYSVTLLKEKDLGHVFDYVDKTYGTKKNNRQTLYDDHKPVHVFLCAHCKQNFEAFQITKRHKQGLPVFCNTKCSALHRNSLPAFKNRGKICSSEYDIIKVARKNGMILKDLAMKYDVSIPTILNILKNK